MNHPLTHHQLKKHKSHDSFKKFISPYPIINHKYTHTTINTTNSTQSNYQPNKTSIIHHHYQSNQQQSSNHQEQSYSHPKLELKDDVKDRLISIYQSQNNNLKEHNKFLCQQLRKQQKNSAILNQQLNQMALQLNKYKSLEFSNNNTIQSKQYIKPMENILEKMDNEFKKMVEEYCKDDNNQKKSNLRFSLASLAAQIKQMRKIVKM